MRSDGTGGLSIETSIPETVDSGWVWIDVVVADGDVDDLVALTTRLDFDGMAVRDAVEDLDVPKVDDFGHHLLVILHGLRDDRVGTYEVDCFMTSHHLVTVHQASSPAIDALWIRLQDSPELAHGGVDELLGRIADVLTRRLLAVLDAFDERSDELVDKALAADPGLVAELTAVRGDVATVRRVLSPQRETLDQLRVSVSPLIGDPGRRRFSDAFDVAVRATVGLESARGVLAEVLDAYRGAEARLATDVTKVLTIYAAIMLPLSLVAGFFGMNFANLPLIDSDSGWVIVTGVMVVIAAASLGIFVSVGWMVRPSGRRAGEVLGRGLIEAARAPAQVVGAAYEISTMPLRATTRLGRRRPGDPGS
jgi:magnesium transporter